MAFPTIDEIKQHCRIDFDDEDTLLAIYLSASISKAENFINRVLKERLDDIENETDLLVTQDIKLALLLIIGHWYANREDTSVGEFKSIPMGFKALLEPYRYIPI